MCKVLRYIWQFGGAEGGSGGDGQAPGGEGGAAGQGDPTSGKPHWT